MDTNEIGDFLKSIKNTDIEEVKYKSGSNTLCFKRSDIRPPIVKIAKTIKDNAEKSEEKRLDLLKIKSSMVGTFISAQSNSIKEGDIIAKGQKVGQIEAMKIIKDILSSVEGKVIQILVVNRQPVEYGQPLFLLKQSKKK